MPAGAYPLWHHGTMTSPPPLLTVSQLNASVRDLLEFNYGRVWLRGEVSNLSAPASGHLYFTLKDDQAQVRAAMFKGARLAARLQTPPRNGQQVRVRAKVSLYAPRGDYQLIVEHLEDDGLGALQQAFEQLKARLAAEGLFAAERKRALPTTVRGLAVVTSPSGAAVRDILQVLARRAPGLPVWVLPVPVQGTEAPAAIVAALGQLARLHGQPGAPEFDVVLVARGGGSLEDLQAFNDERVARAMAALPVPVVSGVGHEVDVTIADFVADLRAPTPSAAAELASPDQTRWRALLASQRQRLQQAWQRGLALRRQRLRERLQRLRSPQRLLQDQRQRLDEASLRLAQAQQRQQRAQQLRLATLRQRLQREDPQRRLRSVREQLAALTRRRNSALPRRLQQARRELALLSQRAQSVSPLAVLGRGYALVQRADDGRLLRSVNALQGGDVVTLRLADGQRHATIHPEST